MGTVKSISNIALADLKGLQVYIHHYGNTVTSIYPLQSADRMHCETFFLLWKEKSKYMLDTN